MYPPLYQLCLFPIDCHASEVISWPFTASSWPTPGGKADFHSPGSRDAVWANQPLEHTSTRKSKALNVTNDQVTPPMFNSKSP